MEGMLQDLQNTTKQQVTCRRGRRISTCCYHTMRVLCGRLADRRLVGQAHHLTCQVEDAVEVVTAAPTRPAVQTGRAGVNRHTAWDSRAVPKCKSRNAPAWLHGPTSSNNSIQNRMLQRLEVDIYRKGARSLGPMSNSAHNDVCGL